MPANCILCGPSALIWVTWSQQSLTSAEAWWKKFAKQIVKPEIGIGDVVVTPIIHDGTVPVPDYGMVLPGHQNQLEAQLDPDLAG